MNQLLKPSVKSGGINGRAMYTLYHIVRLFFWFLVFLCLLALEIQGQEYEVELTPFNSAHSDFGAVRYEDGVVFCSNRTKKKLSFDEDSINFYTDMFFARLGSNNTWSAAEIFSQELTDFLNEGPAAFNSGYNQIYYTANYLRQRPSRRERVDEYVLGIQGAELINGSWVKADLFPHNAPKQDYNVAHPCMAPNDSVLYFASNMPGGHGGMDLYKSEWRQGQWSQPVNLGSGINTKGDELFPFVSADGYLYFSTNGRNERGKKQVDIYSCEIRNDGYAEPYLLPYPINTEHDDFAYAEFSGSEFGTLSSNRRDKRDMIYSFRQNAPNFIDCNENEHSVLCYVIEDVRISPIDSMSLIYEWTLGDGKTARGLSVEHCFDGPGVYDIALNVIDTITHSTFFAVSEARLVIPDIQQPYIISLDTLLVGQETLLFADLSSVRKYAIDKHYWIIDHDKTYYGDTLPLAFHSPGYHSVVLGIIGRDLNSGQPIKTCVFKEIFVSGESLPGYPKDIMDPSQRPVMRIRMKETFDPFATYHQAELAPAFHIVLAHSKERMNMDDFKFDESKFQVTETRNKKGEYVYALCESKDLSTLLPVFQELQSQGFREARVQVFNEPVLEGVDWASLRKQEMVEYTELTAEDLVYRKTRADIVDTALQQTNPASAQEVSDEFSSQTTTGNDQETAFVYTDSEQSSSVERTSEQPTFGHASAGTSAHIETQRSAHSPSDSYVLNASGNTAPSHAEPSQVRVATAEDQTQPQLSAGMMHNAVGIADAIHSGESNTAPVGTHESIGVNTPAASANLNSSVSQSPPINDTALVTSSPSEASSAETQVTGAHGSAVTGYVAGEQVTIPDVRSASSRSIEVAGQELYHVIIIESPVQIPLNDPFFSRIRHEIVEIEGMPNGFTYCVGLSKDSRALEPLVNELHGNGYDQSAIRAFSSEELARHIVRKGRYIPPRNAERLNSEFSRIQDIKFEYNRAEIRQESKRHLDYIAAMLLLEGEFQLKISAHTCTVGSHAFNMQLSDQRARSVVDYFVSKGIQKDRLISKGYAATKPLTDNDSEEGRKENRRVEFIIVFDPANH